MKSELNLEEDTPCQYCGEEFNSRGIKQHLHSKHFNEHYKNDKKVEHMQYKCSVCEEKYFKKGSK